jgi:hypothetical protein
MHDARRNPARGDVAEDAAIVACTHGPNETQAQRPSTLKFELRIVERVPTQCWVRCIAWLGV